MDIEALRREVISLARPAANTLPLMSDERLSELVDDMRKVGQREAIWVDEDGLIVDGRNRWVACKLAGIACRSLPVPEDMRPTGMVISYNLNRNDYSLEERALGAGRLANLGDGQRADLAKKQASAIEPASPQISLAEAAKIFGVSPGSAKRGRAIVKANDPELEKAVRTGKVSLAVASSRVTGTAHEKPKRDAKANVAAVKPIRERPVLVHDADDQLAEQVCHLIHRLREVSMKIGPEELYAKFPAKLRHNLDISLAEASFFVGDLHGAWAKDQTKKNAAG